MKLADLRRFVDLVSHDLHAPRTAESTGTALAGIYSSLERLETEAGHPLITRAKAGWTLTDAGSLLLDEAKRRIAEAPPTMPASAPAGGKAKASKGKGRAPIVKGQPKPYKKRQGR